MSNTTQLFHQLFKILAPPPELTVSEWADEYRKLSPESSSEPGRWRTDRAPYQKEIMDAVNDPETETVVVMSSAQVGKTELINNVLGYYIDYDPSPILLLMPTKEMAESYSKDRLAPMLRDTPALRKKVKDARTRDSDNTLLHKKFPGGSVTLVGANSPSGLASRPIRIVLADEVDRYPASAGTEGDPLSLAAKRTKNFYKKKKIYVSTPTIKGASRIEAEFENSTKEIWTLSCPSCGFFQPLLWGNINFDDVTMTCSQCKERHNEYEWKQQEGAWFAQNEHSSKRGFQLNALASPWEKWSSIIAEFKEAKKQGVESLKTWVNTSLGETWEDESNATNEDELIKRRETYNAEVPDGVLILTAGVDVQDDRLEVEVVGWGVNKESWGISYQKFYGDPGQDALWNQLDNYLSSEFSYHNEEKIPISCTCIDSGGHYTSEVYKFCKPREQRRIFAVKGRGGEGVPFIGKPSRNNRERAALFSIGVDSGKETILSRLQQEQGNPGYCHFPQEEEKGYDEQYFRGLTSEKRVTRYYKGQPKIEWVKKSNIPNEPLDLRNYATAALGILNPDLQSLQDKGQNGSVYQQNHSNQRGTGRKRRRKGVVSKGVR